MHTYIYTNIQVLPIVTIPLKDNYLTNIHIHTHTYIHTIYTRNRIYVYTYTYLYILIHTYIHTYLQVLPIVTLPLKDNYLTDKHMQGILDSVYPDMTPGVRHSGLRVPGNDILYIHIRMHTRNYRYSYIHTYIHVYIHTYIHAGLAYRNPTSQRQLPHRQTRARHSRFRVPGYDSRCK